MELTLYQIDAFTDQVFKGNPAAVCPLESWLSDSDLQAIAAENNLSETAFYIPLVSGFHLRWFTPKAEVDLCGHATLATAFVIFNLLNYADDTIYFETKSGELTVTKKNDRLVMDFPSQPAKPCATPHLLIEGLGKAPIEVLSSEDYMAVFGTEEDVMALKPNFDALNKLDLRGVVVTAEGKEVDFVSRFFAPRYGINEDPVTGSAHCSLTPYWADKLNKTILSARQVSERTGYIECELKGNRVLLSGKAVKYMEGKINF
ncbi:MAG: PhzF family phenazine biosynthesis protein [Desulfobacterales bacterium]|jgi:PhzF family phenazine biosynthesis protein